MRPPLLFDLDGVIVDSTIPIVRSMAAALAHCGLAPADPEVLRGTIGSLLAASFGRLATERGADLTVVPDLIAAYRADYTDESLHSSRAYEGVPDLLAALASTRALGICTSKPIEFTRPILEHLGLAGHFSVLCGPSLTELGETKTQTAGRALDALSPRATALVGDRHHDMNAARAHGLVAVGVTYGFGDEAELRDAGADHVVHSPSGLADVLDSL